MFVFQLSNVSMYETNLIRGLII